MIFITMKLNNEENKEKYILNVNLTYFNYKNNICQNLCLITTSIHIMNYVRYFKY